jgi:hypothetical protein
MKPVTAGIGATRFCNRVQGQKRQALLSLGLRDYKPRFEREPSGNRSTLGAPRLLSPARGFSLNKSL